MSVIKKLWWAMELSTVGYLMIHAWCTPGIIFKFEMNHPVHLKVTIIPTLVRSGISKNTTLPLPC